MLTKLTQLGKFKLLKLNIKAPLLCCFLFLLSFKALADQPLLSRWHLPPSLDTSAVTSIFRSSSGFFWIGTQNGLIKYDGNRTKIFSPEKTGKNWIPNSGIRDITEDSHGNIYVATFGGGMLKWSDTESTFYSITNFSGTHSLYLNRMIMSSNGKIWISGENHIIQYDPANGQSSIWNTSSPDSPIISRPIALVEDQDGHLVYGNRNTISVINQQDDLVRTSVISGGSLGKTFKVTAMEIYDKELLFVGTDTGHIVLVDKTSGRVIREAKTHSNYSLITDIHITNGKLIIATDQGLFLSSLDFSGMKEISYFGSGLPSRDIFVLYDHGDYLLVGTMRGLSILKFSPFLLSTFENSSTRTSVQAFAESADGGIWIGTYDGLYRLDHEGRSHTRKGHKNVISESVALRDHRIISLEVLGDELWVGLFKKGIDLVSASSGLVISSNHVELGEAEIIDMAADSDSNEVWIATFDRGLFRIKDRHIESLFENGRFAERSVTLLSLLSSGDMIIGAIDRVYRYRTATNEIDRLRFSYDGAIQNPFIYSVTELRSGDILFGSRYGGLYVWKRQDQVSGSMWLRRSSPDSSITRMTVYGVQEDLNGDIWLSTHRGILKSDTSGSILGQFGLADGLQGQAFSFGSSFRSSDGRIFFGGPGGYNVFRPEEIRNTKYPAETMVTSIQFPGNQIDIGLQDGDDGRTVLSHKDHFITFEFSIMDFVHAGNSEFRYLLENFDKSWINNGRNYSATYTNLPPGDYRFRVQGMNSSGVWDQTGASVSITVLPPPWKTGWAYAIYAVLLAIFVWVMHRVYHSYIVDRRAAAMHLEMFENEERADDEMQEQIEYQDELMKLAYRHRLDTLDLVGTFLADSGTSSREILNKQGASSDHRRLRVLSKLEEHIFYGPNGPTANLFEFVESLLPELMIISEVPTDRIVTVNKIPDSLTPCSIASPLAVIIYELVSNSLLHAFDASSAANYLFIDLELDSQGHTSDLVYRLSVTDSGIGCPQNLFDLAEAGSGIGIVLKILELLEGTIELDTTNGTSIVLTLPAGE